MGLFPDWATPDWMKNAGLPVSEIDNADQPLIPAQVENYVPTTQQFQADNYIIPTNDNPIGVSEMDNATTDLTPAAARANGTANVSLDDIARQVMAEKNAPPQKEITVSSIANDLANSVGNYLKGAGQGFNEMRTAQLQQANNLMDGNYNNNDASYVNRAQQQFVKGTLEPIVMPAAMVVPQLRPIAGALMVPDIVNSINEKGLGETARDFTYGPITDDLRDHNLEQRFRENPASTTGQLAMDLVNAVLLGKGAKAGYNGAKEGIKTLDRNTNESLDNTLSAPDRFTVNGLDALDQYDNETRGFRPANADEMKQWNADQQAKQDARTQEEVDGLQRIRNNQYGNVFDQEQEPRFGDDAQLSDMPQGAQGQTISPLLDALERAKQAKWDETQQDYSDQNNARQGLVNTLNEVAGKKFDDAENTIRNNSYDSLNDTDKLTADLLNHHNNESGVTPDEILSELKAERDRMLQDHADHILETVDAQSPEQMVLENNSGDRFARNVSMKYDFANKAAQTVGKKYWSQLSKRDKNYLAQQEAESHLRNGYRDPMYGDIIPDEMADHYNNLEAAINGLETSIPNIKSATRPEIWEPKQGGEGRTESLHQATEDARNIIGEAESPLHQQLVDTVKEKTIANTIKDILSSESGAINPGKIADVFPHIAELGKQVLQSGYKTFGEWAGRMKEHLGDVWDSVKGHMQNIWGMINNERGSIRPFSDPLQDFTSADTSINKERLPAVFSKVKWNSGTVNADIGGGKFDNATYFLKDKGIENIIYDPFNRSKDHNETAISRISGGKTDTATIPNVLNVINTAEGREGVIVNAADAIKTDGTAYFYIYEGNKTGAGKVTQNDRGNGSSWQENRVTASYIPEIKQYFEDVVKKGQMIIARKPLKGKFQSNSDITQTKLNSGFDPTFGKYDNITLKDIENGAFDKIYEAVTNSNKTPDTPLWRQRTEQPTQQERPTLTGNQAILAQNIPDEIRGLVEKYSPNYEREIPPLIPTSPNNNDKSTNPIHYAINKLDKLYQAAIDDKHPLNKVDSELYKQARVANAKAYGQATELLTREGTNSFNDILEPVKHQTKEFSWYLEAVHSLDQQAAGLKTRMTLEDAQTVIDHAPDTFKTAQKQIVDYNGRLLDKLVEGKVLTQDAVDTMRQKWPNYVPFMRDFSDTAAIDSFVRSKGFINVANPIKKLKGSEREVIDPLESIIKNTYIFTNIAERNKVGLAFTKLADRPGEESLVVRVDGQHTQDTKLGIFTVYENGKKQAYRTTPELYKSMASLDGEASNFLTDILATPAGWLRAGATLTPDFMVRNTTRDAISAYINSNSGFIPVVDTLKGLSHAFKKDDLYWDWLTNGGGMSTLISLDRQGLQTKLKDFRAKTGTEKLVTAINPKTYLEMLRTMSEYSELGTRLGVYDRATSKGINPLDSIIDSREASIDFGRSGTRAKMFNRISAFLNANLQDTDKLIRNFKDPKTRMRTMSKITTSLIIPSVAVWYMGKDDERVQRLPSWQKDLFWIVPTKASGPGWDGLIRIPKPFGPGVLFASGTERMLDWAYKNKKEPFKGYGGSMYDAFVPNIVPTAAVPLMEWWANKSMFTGQDIVPRREQGLSDKMQYGPNTTELAKKVGDTFNVSPRKIDNTVYGYTGGLGRNVTDIGNYFFKDRSNQPTTPVTQIPLAKAFTATSYNNSQPVQDYYDKVKETSEKMNDYKLKGIKPDDVTQQNHTDLNKSTKLMQGLLKAERAVMTDTSLTPDQKRQKLDDIQLYQSKAAEAIIKKLH